MQNLKNRALNDYCLCSGAMLWAVGFKEGSFLHAKGCPRRWTQDEKKQKAIYKLAKDEKNKLVRKMQKLLSA
jgi:hypothetical protein